MSHIQSLETPLYQINTHRLGALKRLGSAGGLISKNIKIDGNRTSVRLEAEMWDALHDIAMLESCTIHDVSTAVYALKPKRSSFTAALRVFLLQYFKNKAMADRRIEQITQSLRAS